MWAILKMMLYISLFWITAIYYLYLVLYVRVLIDTIFWAHKAELLQEGIIFLIHLFARSILLMKKLKIKETEAT